MEVIEQTTNTTLTETEQAKPTLFTTAAIIKGILRGQIEIARKQERNRQQIDRMAKFLGEISKAELALNPPELKQTPQAARERIRKIKEADPERRTADVIQISIHESALITSTAQFERQFLPIGKSLEGAKKNAPTFRLEVDESLPLEERTLYAVQLDPSTLEPL